MMSQGALLGSSGDEEAMFYCTGLNVQENEDIKSGYAISLVRKCLACLCAAGPRGQTADGGPSPRVVCRQSFKENPFFSNKMLVQRIIVDAETGTLRREGTTIDWLPGGNLLETSEPHAEEGETGSFFGWFAPSEGDVVEADEVGDMIKDDLWPNAVAYYQVQFSSLCTVSALSIMSSQRHTANDDTLSFAGRSLMDTG